MSRRLSSVSWMSSCVRACGVAASLWLGTTASIEAASLAQARTGPLSPNVPAPESVLGFAPGERPAHYYESLDYYQALAKASPRVQLRDYGRTGGGRRLIQLIISSPENLAKLDTIHADLRRLGDELPVGAAARALIDRLPGVAWLGAGIHGDEISGSDAAIELAYRLAAGEDAETADVLRDVVIHLDPMFNPDGRERSLAHTSAFSRRTPNEDPSDLSHWAFWPGGRGNHHFFDLNRDALYTVQPDSRARVAAILDARPQMLLDAHEMNADRTFLFAVPAEPFNPYVPRGVHRSWQSVGKALSAAFDRDGTSFYTRAWNEVFYPGYFDIWPAYAGAVPLIFEQGATSGTTIRLPNGKRRSYAEAVEHQLRSYLAALKTAAAQREALLTRWWEARREAAQGGSAGPKAWVILPDDPFKLRQAIRTLRTQGLQVERLQSATKTSGLRSMWEAEAQTLELPVGTLRVRAAQPNGAMAHNLLDLHVPMSADFLRRERQRVDLGEGTSLYDTTAWSLPHAFGASVFWSDRVPAGDWRALGNEKIATPQPVALSAGRYGYIYRDPSLLFTARLLEREVKVRVARAPFALAGERYDRGTLLIRNDDQSFDVLTTLRAEQALGDTSVTSVDSARIFDGPDLGDEVFQLLKRPRIGILAGAGTESTNVGALMYLLDVSAGVPFTLFDLGGLTQVTLSEFNVLVLPDIEEPDRVAALLGSGGLTALRQWMEGGGTLIALRRGSLMLAGTDLTSLKTRQAVIDKYPPAVFDRSAQAVVSPAAQPFLRLQSAAPPGADKAHVSIGGVLRQYLPNGSYLRVDLKPTHWLTYGVSPRLPAMFRESEALIADGAAETIGRYAEARDLAMSGLVWPEAVGYIAGTVQLVREPRGAGQIILFAGDPVFRGYSLGTQRLFVNALVLGPALR